LGPSGLSLGAAVPARSEIDKRKKALEDKRKGIVDARLRGASAAGKSPRELGSATALPKIRDLEASR
jgi:hypothetical protein